MPSLSFRIPATTSDGLFRPGADAARLALIGGWRDKVERLPVERVGGEPEIWGGSVPGLYPAGPSRANGAIGRSGHAEIPKSAVRLASRQQRLDRRRRLRRFRR